MVFFFGDPYFGALANPAVIGGSCGDGLMEEALAWPSGPCHGRYGSMMKGLHLQASADHYDITADLPGFKPEDIKVELLGRNRMAVTAEIKQSSETKANDADADQGRRVSRKLQRSFRQVMKLPSDVDEAGVSARVEHGVLSVVVPRRKDLPEGPRIIPVLDAKAEASHQADDAQPGVTAKDEEMARD